MNIELKPCPFCGESLVNHADHHGSWWAHREEPGPCIDSTIQIMTEDEAKRWNRRAPVPAEKVVNILGGVLPAAPEGKEP